jgi:hypothetical protein
VRLGRAAAAVLFGWLALAGLPALPTPSAAAVEMSAEKQAPSGPRKSVWSVGLTGQRHSLKSGIDDDLLGNSALVQLGTGRIAESWYANASLDIILGPYEPTRQKQLNVDFVGTGLTVWTGFSAQTLDLRSQAGGYGFALGLSYADIVGRSQGSNRALVDCGPDPKSGCEDANARLIDQYQMRVTNLAVQPAIFFSWLSAARPEGNNPALLATRLEGYFLTVGLAIPLIANYQVKYTTLGSRHEPAESGTAKGRLRGYSLVVGLTAMLGT